MPLPPFRFATLTPENIVAQKCLASLVDRQPPESPVHLVAVAQGDGATPREPASRAAKSKYQLVLSFDSWGSADNNGWVIGKLGGRSSVVDLPICSSRSRHLKGSQICEISIHPQSGAFMLWNTSRHHSIVYLQADKNADVELQYDDKYILHMSTNRFRIGPLDFVLQFCIDDEEKYTTQFKTCMRQRHPEWDHHRRIQEFGCLDMLPRYTQLDIGNIIIHHTISRGAFGIVRAGIEKRSGDVVACKTIHCGPRDAQVVINEIDIAARIPAQTVGLVRLISSWCEHGHPSPCFQTALEDIHLLMPYAPFTFATAPWQDIDLPTRLVLFRQVLEGLRNLHAMEIMHRDISPRNLLVFSYRPPAPATAAICDFGKSKKGTRGIEASLGPRGFTAPEVWHRKGYTNAIDIFSLGLSMLATFAAWHWEEAISKDIHTKILDRLAGLQSRIPDELGALLHSMLVWDPCDRPTAEEALACQVWEQIGPSSPDPLDEDEAQSGADLHEASHTSVETGERGRGRLQRSDGPSLSSGRGANKRLRESDQTARAMPASHMPLSANKKSRKSHSSGPPERRLQQSSDGSPPPSPPHA